MYCKSSLFIKVEWKKYPIHWNWLKSTNSRHFWMIGIQDIKKLQEVQKTRHFSIFEAKFIFSDKNTVELMPMMSKLAWNRLFPGNIQSSRKFLEVSRTDEILKFCIENEVSWQKLSGKNIPYIKNGPNLPIPGQFWISGSLESRI